MAFVVCFPLLHIYSWPPVPIFNFGFDILARVQLTSASPKPTTLFVSSKPNWPTTLRARKLFCETQSVCFSLPFSQRIGVSKMGGVALERFVTVLNYISIFSIDPLQNKLSRSVLEITCFFSCSSRVLLNDL